MRKITSFPEYKEITKSAKEQGYTVTNCYFMPNAIREKTDKNKLFVKNIDPGLLILEDESDFFRCYYFLPAEVIPSPVILDKKAVIELPYQEQLTPAQKQQVAQISGMGFQLGRRSGMMLLPAENVIPLLQNIPEETVLFASQEDTGKVLSLLYDCFNPLYSYIPDEEEMFRNISENRVWIIRNEDQLAAVLNSRLEKNNALISHVAVAREFRGRGYGKMLVEVYHRAYKNQVRNFQHWVDLDNTSALNMYSAFGYQFTSRKANEYILLENC